MKYVYKTVKTPVGELKLIASEKGLAAILWQNDRVGRVRLPAADHEPNHPLLRAAEKELKKYFAGEIKRFTVPLDLRGTEFQKKVWRALLDIPFGKTRSYGELAVAICKPRASRAVGAANGKNPVSIMVPCHRVIGANGKLTGFAGGLGIKRQLLELERGSR